MFVFAAMAEFSCVLLVKQIQECENIEINHVRNGQKSEKMPINKVNEASNTSIKVDSKKLTAGAVRKTIDHETRNINFWRRKCAILNDLPITTKIDFAGFMIFYFIYLVVNFLYWVPVLNHYYGMD